MKKLLKISIANLIMLSMMATALPASAASTIYGDSVSASSQGLRKDGSAVLPARSITASALGAPDGTFFSLGFGGSITVEFANYVGTNLSISTYEITNGTYPFETANVETSQNGSSWTSIGIADNDSGAGPNPHVSSFDLASRSCIKFVRITDTSDPAPFTNDADGFDVDAVSATYDETCTPPTPTPCDCTNPITETMVSDLNTIVVGDTPTAVVPHPAWTASIPGATWIWKSGGTAANEVVSFEQNFSVTGTVSSATLNIATDNSYKVFLDNVEVVADPADNNFQLATQDTHDLSLAVTPGNHTLRIEVKNVGVYNASSNPAGLLYKFEIKSCPPECCGGDVKVEIENNAVVKNNVDTSADSGDNKSEGGKAKSKAKARGFFSDATSTANGGNGGSITTGNADALSSVTNVVNTNKVRVRR